MVLLRQCLVLAALSLVSALPATETPFRCPSYSKQKYVDNFDGAGYYTYIGVYNGLNYEEFYANNATASVTHEGVITHSGATQVAAASVYVDDQYGYYGVATPFGTISTRDTFVSYFSLPFFYFACVTSVTLMPVSCTVEVSGFNVFGNPVRSKAFNYAPTSGVYKADMSKGALPVGYSKLQNITFAVATADVALSNTVLFLDSITHTNYECDGGD